MSDGTVSYVVLTFESLLKTLWFDHQNESHLAAHLQGATFFSFSILQNEFWNFLELCGLFVLFMHGGQMAESGEIKLSMYYMRAP